MLSGPPDGPMYLEDAVDLAVCKSLYGGMPPEDKWVVKPVKGQTAVQKFLDEMF